MKPKTKHHNSNKFEKLLSESYFFVATLVIFALNSFVWVFTAIYPLPFDEYYHLGVIKLYSEQWSPFITNQPIEASLYGDITRSTSYMYHYLMSFPYRVLDAFISSDEIVIICLRLLNVGLVLLSLVLFRRLLIKMGFSKKIIHIAIFFLAITPIFPFLAAHINYDNLQIVLVPLLLIKAWDILSKKTLEFTNLAWFLSIGMFGSIVKETFLPIFFLVSLYLVISLSVKHKTKLISAVKKSIGEIAPRTLVPLVILLLLTGGLFFERYAINVVRYGSLSTECDVVQPVEVCENFAPWYRNNVTIPNRVDIDYGGAGGFSVHWVSKIMRGFYAIFSHTPTRVVSQIEPFGPIELQALLPIPIAVGYFGAVVGLGAIILKSKRLIQNPASRFLLFISVGFITILWFFNYTTYLKLGSAQAIQARYTLPILLLLLTVSIQALGYFDFRKQSKQWAIGIIVGAYLYSGGAVGWLIRSNSLWYWQNENVIKINQTTQNVLKKIIIH